MITSNLGPDFFIWAYVPEIGKTYIKTYIKTSKHKHQECSTALKWYLKYENNFKKKFEK